jgi:hypothetical protein
LICFTADYPCRLPKKVSRINVFDKADMMDANGRPEIGAVE